MFEGAQIPTEFLRASIAGTEMLLEASSLLEAIYCREWLPRRTILVDGDPLLGNRRRGTQREASAGPGGPGWAIPSIATCE